MVMRRIADRFLIWLFNERERFKADVGSPFRPVVGDLYSSPGHSSEIVLIRDPSLCDCPGGPASKDCIHMYHGKFIPPVRRIT